MDPLAPLGRQEQCWCGSQKTYRVCHKRWTRPQSQVGAPIPPDRDDVVFLSPKTSLARALIPNLMPPGGAPITMPSEEIAARPTAIAGLEWAIAHSRAEEDSLGPKELGELRSNLLYELSRLPDNDQALGNSKSEAIASASLLAWQTAGSLALAAPRPSLLWNEELDPTAFIRRTILLADHVLCPDKLLEVINDRPTNRRVRERAIAELAHDPLIRSGRVIAVPSGAALALGVEHSPSAVVEDLKNARLIDFVRSQLVIEGPTAREALFVNAKDDLEHAPYMWFYAHILAGGPADNGAFRSRLLGAYDPTHDYGAWVDLVTRQAIASYIQRSAERVTVADLFGAEYVASSLFEARLLRFRRPYASFGPASASLWADIPSLSRLDSADLVQILGQDDAVEDLRARVRLAMSTAPSLAGQVDALRHLASEIEHSSSRLERTMSTDRAYAAIAPSILSVAGLVVGSAAGPLGLAGAALGGVAGILPYVASRQNNRREAAYLFVMARRMQGGGGGKRRR